MQTISRDEVQQKIDNGGDVALIETLPAESFEDFHLPGAVNVPLDEQFEEHIQQEVPDKNQEVVVYCASSDCDASVKAARKLQSMGYKQIYDYEAGKADWKAAGLPVES
jgi:rhodanese-related sulfurtransferase